LEERTKMHLRNSYGWVVLAGAFLVLSAACGGMDTSDATGDGADTTVAPSTETMPEPASEAPVEVTAAMPEDGEGSLGAPTGDCGQLATLVETGVPIDITMFGAKQYTCVVVPEGVTRLEFEITELTGALNLYVGFPDLATLEAGGEGSWASENGGRDDESIVIESGPTGFVSPGTYFIEVSGGASADSATYVLTVSMA
jgi:hypothetical protein